MSRGYRADRSETERRQQYYPEKKNVLKFFLIRRHLHCGYFQLWIDWQLQSQLCQLSITLSKHKSMAPEPPSLCAVSSTGLPGANHSKTLTSSSLPEGHYIAGCQNPFYFKLHVPAAQCDTIRSWLCVNQMMTAWPCCCLACCHSLVANPLPQESGNWFPGIPWEFCSPYPAHGRVAQVSPTWEISTGVYIHIVISLCTLTCNTLEPQIKGFHLLLHTERGI